MFSVNDDPGGYINTDGSFERYANYGQITGFSGMREVNLTLKFDF